MNVGGIYLIFVGVFALVIIMSAITPSQSKGQKRIDRLSRYKELSYETTEEELIAIMGSDYIKRLNEDHSIEYEWTWNKNAVRTSGVGVSLIPGVIGGEKRTFKDKGVIVTVKDGKVIKVNPYNV